MAGSRDEGRGASGEVWRAAGLPRPGYEVSRREFIRAVLDAAAKAAANAGRRLSGWGRSRLGGGGGGGPGGSDGGRRNTGGDGASKGAADSGTEGASKAKSGADSTGANRSSTSGGAGGGSKPDASSDRTHILGIDVHLSGKHIANCSNSLKMLEEYATEMRSGLRKLNDHLDKYEHSPEAAEALTKLATSMSNQFERASLKPTMSSHLETLLGFTVEAEKVSKLPKRWYNIAYALGIVPGIRYIYDRVFQNMQYSPEPIECPYTGLLAIVPAREPTLMSIEHGLSRMLELLPPSGSRAVEGLLSVLPSNESLEENGEYVVPIVMRRYQIKSSPATNAELQFWLLRELDKVKIETPQQATFIEEQKRILKKYTGGETDALAGDGMTAK